MSYSVYKHTSPSGKVYIGITCRDPKARWQNGKGYSKEHFRNAIKKYGWNNFAHEILYVGLTESEAKIKEIELIKFYDSTNPKCGYNLSPGGNMPSAELRKRTSERMKKRCGELSARSKRVMVFDAKSGYYIGTFISARECSIYFGFPQSTKVAYVAKTKSKHSRKMIFIYEDDYSEELLTTLLKLPIDCKNYAIEPVKQNWSKEARERVSERKRKGCICIETGEKFESAKKAMDKYGTSVGKNLSGKNNSAYGLHFEYLTKEEDT